ncbi:type II secretion system protein [Salmonella enterica]|nr:type II secretion system protein [Salmonella enterica]
MAGKSVLGRKLAESRGFSLLEILVVLVFIGVILVTAANYARKMIDEKSRQTAADAVAQEIYGLLQFVNTDTIMVSVNNKTRSVINPLYQRPDDPVYINLDDNDPDGQITGIENNPIWLAHPGSSTDKSSLNVSPYIARTYSKGISSPVSNQITISDNGTYYSHFLNWSQAVWGQNSARRYFTDSGCQGASGSVYFNQQFLSCNENPVLHNSEIAISRIDLVNALGTLSRTKSNPPENVAVNRVDVYVRFIPADGNSARIEQFITPLMTAFRAKKIFPNTDAIYLVRQQDGTNNGWTLLNKSTGQPAGPSPVITAGHNRTDLAMASDLPDLISKLEKGKTYALRFTFDGNGDYLRTDGLNSATKVCWNTQEGIAGPCLTSPSPDILKLTQRQDHSTLANLQAGNVVSTVSYKKDGITVDEYYTVPRIQYAAFSNLGDKPGPLYLKFDENNKTTVLCNADNICPQTAPTPADLGTKEYGAILTPVIECPVVPDFSRPGVMDNDPDKHKLYPRLSVSVSSLVSGIPVDSNGKIVGSDITDGIFSHQGENFNPGGSNFPLGNLTVNRLGGVILQVTPDNSSVWHISSVVATEGINNGQSANIAQSWQYYNPSWLSVVMTSWCSSVPQN